MVFYGKRGILFRNIGQRSIPIGLVEEVTLKRFVFNLVGQDILRPTKFFFGLRIEQVLLWFLALF